MNKFWYFLVLCFLTLRCFAQSLDSSHYHIVDSLIQASMNFVQNRDFEQAVSTGKRALDTSEFIFGIGSIESANPKFNLGRVYRFKGELNESERWYLEALVLQEKLYSKEHPDYAQTLYNLAALYVLRNEFDKAEVYFKESMQIRKKVLGEHHSDIYYNLNSLTDLYFKQGRYSEGMIYIEEALSRKEKQFGIKHPSYASSLIWRGLLQVGLGKHAEAIRDYIEAKLIIETSTGKAEPEYTYCLNNLAIAYWEMGEISKVEPLLNESLLIRENALGKKHPSTVRTKLNLANYLLETGNYSKAEPLFLDAKEFFKESLGPLHQDYARCLNNLAGLYNRQAKYELVLPLCIEQLEIQAKTIGTNHPEYAISLNNMALLYEVRGDYRKAEELLIEALKIRKSVLGVHHHEYAFTIRTLGRLYRITKRFTEAEKLLNEASVILEKTLGKEHIEYLIALSNLALLHKEQGNIEHSQELFEELAHLEQKLIRNSIFHLSEEEIQKYIDKFEGRQKQIFKFADQLKNNVSRIHALAYELALFEKGFLLQVKDRLRRLSMIIPDFRGQYDLFINQQSKLAAELSKPGNLRNEKWVDSLKLTINELDKSLARKSVEYENAIQHIQWKDISEKLLPGELAIEFIHYKDLEDDPLTEIKYAAILVKNGYPFPKFIPLFNESVLDSLFYGNQERKNEYVNAMYSLKERGVSIANRKKRTLYEILWKPIEEELKNVQKIYYAPIGLLHRMNIDAIPVNESETMADLFTLVALNSTRQLVITDQMVEYRNEAVVYGGIQFDADSSYSQDKQMLVSRTIYDNKLPSVQESMEVWDYLPGTLKEATTVNEILNKGGMVTNLFLDTAASESSFKKMGFRSDLEKRISPRVIHIATHGYFFEDKKEEVGTSQGAVKIGEPVYKTSDHPMLRSGLIMAGGNAAWQGKQRPEGNEDGILTAYEISQMNLSNTELVVLSACETGLGDIQGNEGVYGLQRAFKIAGAKYIIMSLWQVPDKQTSMLMITFYKKWLEEKMSIPDAFRAAQKELRDFGLDPYQWAGFVLVE